MADWSFDRAADYYDATRALPEAVLDDVTRLLASELGGRACILEIGVGTGRIALPLYRRGVPLIGTDISRPMLDRLVANAGGGRLFPVVVSDATALAVGEGSIDAAVASHVLHLIPSWRTAVDEVVRALRPGGVFLVDFGGGVEAPWGKSVQALLDGHGVHHIRPGVSRAEDVADHLGKQVSARPLAPITMTVRRSLRRDLAGWEAQIHSWTWQYPPEQMMAACADVRRWAADKGILDGEVELERVIQWWVFEKVV